MMTMIVIMIIVQNVNMVHKKNTFIIAILIIVEEITKFNKQINETKPLDYRK